MIEAKNFIKGSRISNNKENKQPSFQGNKILRDNKGQPTDIEFFTPGYTSGVLTVYKMDQNGSAIQNSAQQYDLSPNLKGLMTAKVKFDPKNPRLLYQFTDHWGNVFDELTERKNGYNITIDPKMVEYKQPRTIYHFMEDSFNIPGADKAIKDDQVNWRDHFKLYGGGINGIIKMIPKLKELGMTSLMGTPLFGSDNLSCHGYWAENNYKIASKFGTLSDFDRLNIELFKNGMRWIADGAYVNQGIQGVQFQDVLRRAAKGEDSPLKAWFDFHAPFGSNFNMPLLPHDDSLPTTTKVKNDAFKIEYTNMQYNPDKTPNKDYDPRKPSYLNLVPSKPDGKFTRSWDSVQKYALPVSPDYHVTGNLPYRLTTIVDPNGSSYETWDGNCDTVKLALQKVETKNGIVKKDPITNLPILIKDGEDFAINKDIKEYIIRASEYWTTNADNTLISYASKEIQQQITKNGGAVEAADSKQIFKAINDLIKDKKLPDSVSYLTENDISNALQNNDISLKKLIFDDKGNLSIKDNFAGLADMLPSYPLTALDLPKEVLAVFSYPSFKTDLEKTKFEENLNSKVSKIIDKMAQKQKINNPEIARLVYQDLAKSMFTKALTGYDWLPGTEVTHDLPQKVEEAYYDKMLKDNCDFLKLNAIEASKKLSKSLSDGLKNVDEATVAKHLDMMIENIDPKLARVAKMIVTEAECGCDWRLDASKDVARIYNFKQEMDYYHRTMSERGINPWDQEYKEGLMPIFKPYYNLMNNFWSDFGKTTKMINPKASIIGEVTDVPWQVEEETLGKLCNPDGMTTTTDYHFMFGSVSQFHNVHSESSSERRPPSDFEGYAVKTRAKTYPHASLTTLQVPLDNHDKTRVLHNYIVTPDKFADGDQNSHEMMIATVQSALCATTKELLDSGKLPDDYITANPQSNFALVYNAIEKLGNKTGKDFAYWPIEKILSETRAEVLKDNPKADKNELVKITQGISKNLFKNSSQKALGAFLTMVGNPGAPTLYSGDELRMTGGSTGRYNQIVHNRNPVYIDGEAFYKYLADEYKVDYDQKDIEDFYNKTKSIFSIRTNPAARVLNTGFVKTIKADNDKGVLATLRYDDKDMALVLQSSGKVNAKRADDHKFGYYQGNFAPTMPEVKELNIDSLYRKGIDVGTIFYNIRNTNQQYIVWTDGSLRERPGNVFEENGMRDYLNKNSNNPPPLISLTGDNAIGMILIRDNNALNQARAEGKIKYVPIDNTSSLEDDILNSLSFKGRPVLNKVI